MTKLGGGGCELRKREKGEETNPMRSEEGMRHVQGTVLSTLSTLVESLEIWVLDRPEKHVPGTCAHPWYCVNAARHGGTKH